MSDPPPAYAPPPAGFVDPNKQYPPPQQGYPQGPPPQQGYPQGPPPPQQGYPQGPPPQHGYQAQQATTVVVGQTQPAANVVVMGGGCPSCRVGTLVDDYTCCGIFLAIFFFPLGILCCLAMRERRCTNCGANF